MDFQSTVLWVSVAYDLWVAPKLRLILAFLLGEPDLFPRRFSIFYLLSVHSCQFSLKRMMFDRKINRIN